METLNPYNFVKDLKLKILGFKYVVQFESMIYNNWWKPCKYLKVYNTINNSYYYMHIYIYIYIYIYII